jgi:PKD repeat protein
VLLLSLAAWSAPQIRVEQIADPGEIYVAGSGASPEIATLKLYVESIEPDEQLPVDCIFVIDVSATASGGLGEVATLAIELLDLFGPNDRVGLVSFSDRAWLDVGLTEETSRVMRAIADLETGGKSALGEGLRVARQELLDWGREDARLVEIILSDGQNNVGRTPEVEGDVAAEAGIIMVPIGVGTLINRSLLQDLAAGTDGLFLEMDDEGMLQSVENILAAAPGTRTVRVEKILPPELGYLDATPRPQSVASGPNGTTLVWQFDLMPMWNASIRVISPEEGAWSTDRGSSVAVTDDRERRSTYAIPSRTLTVKEPLPPTAFFFVDPDEPLVGVETELDASGSVVYQDAEIDRYEWDLDGDGAVDVVSDEPITHVEFDEIGEMEILLTVIDSTGRSGEFERTIRVLPSVSIRRTIETCLPNDETIEGARVQVTIELWANTIIHGLSIHEEYPMDWPITLGESSRATARHIQEEYAVDWLFTETLPAGDYRRITYSLDAPVGEFPEIEEGQSGARDQVTISGVMASSSPRLSQAVGGDDKIVRRQYLDVPVVISRWDTGVGAIDLCQPDTIAFDQIQKAIALWISGDTVPHTNQTIDLAMIRDLIAYWLTNTSVFEPLPE